MARVIIFSRTFPSYHPKAGQPTYFVEKMLKSLGNPLENFDEHATFPDIGLLLGYNEFDNEFINNINRSIPKYHTIRAGHRWKVGDKFSPRVWSGIPYRSKQIAFYPDIEVKKVWDYELMNNHSIVNGDMLKSMDRDFTILIAKNDGLSFKDFLDWFKFPSCFEGQIICWDDQINYEEYKLEFFKEWKLLMKPLTPS